MKSIFSKLTLIISALFIVSSCAKKEKSANNEIKALHKTNLKYAKGFEILEYADYKKLVIKTPYQESKENYEFILSNSKNNKIKNSIHTPIQSIVVTSTTNIPMLELLNSENKLVGYPNTKYISSEKTRKLIDEGKVKELGNEQNINTELLLDLKPDAVVGFTINSNTKMYSNIQKMGIPVILNGAWLEETPLGRCEWIKMFGVLLGKEKEADSIFKTIENKYLEATEIASKASKTPSIISGGLYKDIWNLPAGNSFEATFLADANTNYLWKDSEGKGSLSLNIENVYEKGKDAEIWVSPSFYSSLSELENANEIYSKFKAYKNNEVYSFVNKKGPTGGLIYFELAPARPDLVLKDLIKVAHPNLLPNYEFTFFEKLK